MFIVRAFFATVDAAQLAYSSLRYAGIAERRIAFRSRYRPTKDNNTKTYIQRFATYYVHPVRVDALVYSPVYEQAYRIRTCLRHVGGRDVFIWHPDEVVSNGTTQQRT